MYVSLFGWLGKDGLVLGLHRGWKVEGDWMGGRQRVLRLLASFFFYFLLLCCWVSVFFRAWGVMSVGSRYSVCALDFPEL